MVTISFLSSASLNHKPGASPGPQRLCNACAPECSHILKRTEAKTHGTKFASHVSAECRSCSTGQSHDRATLQTAEVRGVAAHQQCLAVPLTSSYEASVDASSAPHEETSGSGPAFYPPSSDLHLSERNEGVRKTVRNESYEYKLGAQGVAA
jgi:hypothetical protein